MLAVSAAFSGPLSGRQGFCAAIPRYRRRLTVLGNRKLGSSINGGPLAASWSASRCLPCADKLIVLCFLLRYWLHTSMSTEVLSVIRRSPWRAYTSLPKSQVSCPDLLDNNMINNHTPCARVRRTTQSKTPISKGRTSQDLPAPASQLGAHNFCVLSYNTSPTGATIFSSNPNAGAGVLRHLSQPHRWHSLLRLAGRATLNLALVLD